MTSPPDAPSSSGPAPGHDVQTSAFDDQVPLSRLVLRSARTGVVVLVLVAVATAYASQRVATREAIDNANRIATLVAAAAVEPLLDDGILTGDPTTTGAVDRAVRGNLLRGSLVRVKIWRQDGTILYSDESRLVGQRFELGAQELATLRTGRSEAGLSDLSEPENRFEEQATKLLEVYVPVRTRGGTPLLFETYFRYEGVADSGRRLWLRFAPLTLGALVLLALLQIPQALSLGRRLRRTQQQREDLLRAAIEATDTERRRIASDLHDGVVQDLAGVTFSLAADARRAEAQGADAAELRESAERVREAVASLRSLLVEIYPPNLYDEGLNTALLDLLARTESRGIETSLVIDAPLDKLSPDVTGLLYRAAQEGLRNVVAHAEAERVDVSVTQSGNRVALEVSDDGRGIGGEPIDGDHDGHFGLKALAGLSATMGGTLAIDSTPGKGTTLCLEVPSR